MGVNLVALDTVASDRGYGCGKSSVTKALAFSKLLTGITRMIALRLIIRTKTHRKDTEGGESRGSSMSIDSGTQLRNRYRKARKGVSTLWLLLLLPLIFILLCFVVEIGNLWLARAELENAMEAAALAAVKEWGDAGGGSTSLARDFGVDYAAANTVRDTPVTITKNYNAGNAPNQNVNCTGNLVFGAITATSPNIVFDAGVAPGCSPTAQVLFDVTAQGSLNSDNLYHAWGISFRNTASTPANLKIDSITITLPTGNFRFNPVDSPALSIAVAGQYKVVSVSGLREQPDIAGFPNLGQITFTPSTGNPTQVTITFGPESGGDQGFEPGDRFRFSAQTSNFGGGIQGGDSIGFVGAQVSVVFNLGGVPQLPVLGTYVDNTHDQAACVDQPDDPLTGSLVVHPTGLPDLPCPTGNPANNGQSLLNLQQTFAGGGGGTTPFGVRAQASVNVNSVCGNLFGLILGPQSVSAESTAIYECNVNDPRLIRVDQFICP